MPVRKAITRVGHGLATSGKTSTDTITINLLLLSKLSVSELLRSNQNKYDRTIEWR